MNWLDRRIDNFIQAIRDSDRVPLPIGPADDPTYFRWFVIPRNRWFNVYLHCFRHSDEEHLHDHRMFNISFILQGWYMEERFAWRPVEGLPLPFTRLTTLWSRRPKFRLPSTPHRVVLPSGNTVWSLFIGFPQIRTWGFWLPNNGSARWVPYTHYVANPDPTSQGYGRRRAAG
jgi:hypothetical protein